ncbi:MAG TPA: hypothetical protein VIY73_19050 [Polyangiaceae bacterium]
MQAARALRATFVVLAVFLGTIAACGDDTGNGGSTQENPQPTSCPPTPCTVGALCYQPAPNANCNGTWYCWSDTTWHCAPEESGGPGDATITFDTGSGDETEPEGSSPPPDTGAPPETGAADAPSDAGGG